MLIGICGTICSGKHTTAEYLVQHHGFLRLHLPTYTTPSKQRHNSAVDKRFLPSVTDEKGTRGLTFPEVDSLLEFVTKRWQEHWVLTDIEDESTLEILLRRPFFLLLSVDAPVTIRFRRFNSRCARRDLPAISLEEFVDADDTLMYGTRSESMELSTSTTKTKSGLNSKSNTNAHANSNSNSDASANAGVKGTAILHSRAHLQILNSYTSIHAYFQLLESIDLPSESRLRPPWDTYFMHLAHLASLRSNCMKRRVGCVLIHNNRIISTGYNGTPRGITNCNAGGCPRCNSGSSGGAALSTCLCLHAEENALLEAGRERIREGAVLYCDTCPCLTCSVKIAQVGVKEVVYSQTYNMDDASRRVLAEAGVKLRQYSPPGEGLQGPHVTVKSDVNVDLEGQLVVRNGS